MSKGHQYSEIDVLGSCPTHFGGECTCSQWWRVINDLPDADLAELIRETIHLGLGDEGFWKRLLDKWDTYEIRRQAI